MNTQQLTVRFDPYDINTLTNNIVPLRQYSAIISELVQQSVLWYW